MTCLGALSHYPNHRWPFYNGVQYLLDLYYETGCALDSTNAIQAAYSWTATPTPINFHWSLVTGCSGATPGKIRVLNGISQGVAIAWSENYHCQYIVGWCFMEFNMGAPSEIDAALVNENLCAINFIGLSNNERQDAIKHELGHNLGMRHAGYYGSELIGPGWPINSYSIMGLLLSLWLHRGPLVRSSNPNKA